MELSQIILSFKDQRKEVKERTKISATVNLDRMANIDRAFSDKSTLYRMLNESEKIDFLLYVLERFLSNSNLVELEALES